jgi:hypothetical protein
LSSLLIAFAGCSETFGPNTPSCPQSVAGLGWSIWATGGTPPAGSTEMQVGGTVGLGVLTFSIGCTIPAYTVSWRHSNPAVATLTANPQDDGARLLGVAPGTTIVTAEIRGDGDGALRTATTQIRVLP